MTTRIEQAIADLLSRRSTPEQIGATLALMTQALTLIDIFCGAGGLSLGFEQAGFRPLLGVDSDSRVVGAYAKNFPNTAALLADAATLTRTDMLVAADSLTATAVVGGPPCAGFSRAGHRQNDDPRNDLLMAFARTTTAIAPDYFVLENVPGLLEARAAPLREAFVAHMRRAGYAIARPWLLNAAEFGVPQERWRVFIVGHRIELPAPHEPAPVSDRVTSREAIGDLEALARLPNDQSRARLTTPAPSRYAAVMRGEARDIGDRSAIRTPPNILTGCAPVQHSPPVTKRFAATLPGTREPVSRFPRLHPDRSSPTLRAGTLADRGGHTAPRPIHYSQPRCVTTREAARLHSLPDWFDVDETAWRGHMQIGNSVPPRLARFVGRSIRNAALAAHTESTSSARIF